MLVPGSQPWASHLFWTFENVSPNAFMLLLLLFVKLKEFPPFDCQEELNRINTCGNPYLLDSNYNASIMF